MFGKYLHRRFAKRYSTVLVNIFSIMIFKKNITVLINCQSVDCQFQLLTDISTANFFCQKANAKIFNLFVFPRNVWQRVRNGRSLRGRNIDFWWENNWPTRRQWKLGFNPENRESVKKYYQTKKIIIWLK